MIATATLFRTLYRPFFLLLYGFGPLMAQAQGPVSPPDSVGPPPHTLLWRVSGPGQAVPSYVFGTMHLLCPEGVAMGEKMTAAFGSSQQLVLEIDMDDPTLSKQVRRAAGLPWPTSLRRLMKQRDFKVVRRFFRRQLHQSVLPYVTIQPALVESVVYSAAFPCTPVGYEEKFMELAKAQHKEILGLESVEDQLGSLKKTPYKEQAQELVALIRAYDSIPRVVRKMMTLYHSQDVEALYQFTLNPRYNPEGQTGALELETRNRNWIPKMQTYMRAQPTFFAVGAAHLGGATGVLQLLRQEGYLVEPVVLLPPRQ